MYITADSGVTSGASQATNGQTVTGWTDSGNSSQIFNQAVGSQFASELPTYTTGVTFPNGTVHNVVTFDGNAGIILNPTLTSNLTVQSLNIFVVADDTTNPNSIPGAPPGTQTSGEFITNYNNNGSSNGWAVGNSDTPAYANQVKWFTGPDGGDALGNTTGLSLTNGTYYSINMQVLQAIASTKSGSTTSDGVNYSLSNPYPETSYGNGTNSIPYNPSGQSGSIGFLGFQFGGSFPNGIQNLYGNIAAILVYNDTGLTSAQVAAQTALVNTYINETYFIAAPVPEPSSVALTLAGSALIAGMAIYRRRAA